MDTTKVARLDTVLVAIERGKLVFADVATGYIVKQLPPAKRRS